MSDPITFKDLVNRSIVADYSKRLDECQICHHEIFSMPAPEQERRYGDVWWFHNLDNNTRSALADADHLPAPSLLIEEEP